MKTFIALIIANATVSSIIGIVTQDIFHALSLYTPLSLISIVIKDSLEDRKIKKQLLKESK